MNEFKDKVKELSHEIYLGWSEEAIERTLIETYQAGKKEAYEDAAYISCFRGINTMCLECGQSRNLKQIFLSKAKSFGEK